MKTKKADFYSIIFLIAMIVAIVYAFYVITIIPSVGDFFNSESIMLPNFYNNIDEFEYYSKLSARISLIESYDEIASNKKYISATSPTNTFNFYDSNLDELILEIAKQKFIEREKYYKKEIKDKIWSLPQKKVWAISEKDWLIGYEKEKFSFNLHTEKNAHISITSSDKSPAILITHKPNINFSYSYADLELNSFKEIFDSQSCNIDLACYEKKLPYFNVFIVREDGIIKIRLESKKEFIISNGKKFISKKIVLEFYKKPE